MYLNILGNDLCCIWQYLYNVYFDIKYMFFKNYNVT